CLLNPPCLPPRSRRQEQRPTQPSFFCPARLRCSCRRALAPTPRCRAGTRPLSGAKSPHPPRGRHGSAAAVHPARRLISQRLVRPLFIVEGEIPPQSPLGVPHASIVLQVDLLVLHAAPQPLHKHVVERAAPPIHADRHPRRQQPPGERRA